MKTNIFLFFCLCVAILVFAITQPVRADFSETPSAECTEYITPSPGEYHSPTGPNGEELITETVMPVGLEGHHCCRAMDRYAADLIGWGGVQACCNEDWIDPDSILQGPITDEISVAALSCAMYGDPSVITYTPTPPTSTINIESLNLRKTKTLNGPGSLTLKKIINRLSK